MSAAASTSCTDFLTRKRFAILHLAHAHRVDLDLVRSAFALGWMQAEREYDPAWGASIDTLASRLAEWKLWREIRGQSNDALHHIGMQLDAATSTEAYTAAILDDDLPDTDRDPATFLQRIAARAQAERHADAVLAALASHPGKRAQQLARVAAIVADGGGREEIIEQLQVEDRRARQLLAEALAAVQGLEVAV